MTVMDRLRAAGAPEDEAQLAASIIGAALPVDRDVRVTDEVLVAAQAGDLALVRMLLAEEVDPEPDELDALTEAKQRNDGTLLTTAEIQERLSL